MWRDVQAGSCFVLSFRPASEVVSPEHAHCTADILSMHARALVPDVARLVLDYVWWPSEGGFVSQTSFFRDAWDCLGHQDIVSKSDTFLATACNQHRERAHKGDPVSRDQ